MKAKLFLMRIFFFMAGAMFAAPPAAAFAHDGVGGDELAAASWMLLAALFVAFMGVLAGIWAWRVGQFSNIEESKYTMLETAEDFDAVMAEADTRERQLHSNASQSRSPAQQPVQGPAQEARS